MEDKHRHFSIFWPVLLITVGIVLFLNNTGRILGSTWEVIWNLWPLLFIIGGIDGLVNRSGFAGPVVAIGLGTIFLLGNFGYLPLPALEVLIKFWPVLLIAWGIDLIIGHRGIWSPIVGVLLGLALIAGTYYLAMYSPAFTSANATQPVSLEREGATQATGTLTLPVGEMALGKGAGEKYLVEGTVTASGKVESSVQVNGTSAVFSIRDTTQGTYTPFSGGTSSFDWNLKLNPAVVYTLSTEVGAGTTEFNLEGLQVKTADLSTGVGKTTIVLPESGNEVVSTSVAVGQTVLQVPQDAAVRIELETALVYPIIPAGFTRSGNVISSPAAAAASEVQVVKVNSAIGLLSIELQP